MFILDPVLNNDCITVGDFPLSTLLMMNDTSYPWFILVPRRIDIREIYQLSEADQQQLLRESSHLASVLDSTFSADKINIAALGNVVKQLHIHHVARYETDKAWPGPIWGRFPPEPYSQQEIAERIGSVASQLKLDFIPA